jgi:hypothetical protein
MLSLIGDRFLKRFFGSSRPRHRANTAGEAMTLLEDGAEKAGEPDYPPRENLPKKEATAEDKKQGETNQHAGPENGSDQPTTDKKPAHQRLQLTIGGFTAIFKTLTTE